MIEDYHNYANIVNTIKSIKLSDFKYSARVDAYKLQASKAVAVRVHIGINDINPDGLGETWLGTPFFIVTPNDNSLDIVDKVRKSLQYLVLHELDEQLLINEQREFNPHNNPGQNKFPLTELTVPVTYDYMSMVYLNEHKIP